MGRKPQAAAESPVSAPGTTVQEVEKIVTGIVDGRVPSAEVDEAGRPWLEGEAWQKMGAGSAHQKQGDSAMEALFKKLYGDLPVEERWRVAWLAGTLFFIIGGYWLLRSLKDPIVSTIVGVEYIPKCKMMSLVVVFALVFVYNKLVDMFPKHQLFYIVGGFYFFTFATIAYLLADPVTGLANTNADPWRLLGWVSYCSIESFGSICVSLFWAFVNSSMDFDGAKSAYGLIIAGAQTGSILGPTMAATFSHTLGVPRLYGLGAMCMGMMVVMVWGYVRIFGVSQALAEVGGDKKKKGAGVLEGFRLFIKHDYVKGIFALSCLFMVEVTILDYIMKVLAQTTFLDEAERAAAAGELDVGANPKEVATEAFAAFMGGFGQVTNSLSFLFSLLGTSYVIRFIGLRRTLLAFPTLCLLVVLVVIAVPKLQVVFFAMILLKGFSYSLNNPCKEMLYQPTSSAVKFKSKSWIDIFGARGSKAAGSIVTNAFSDAPSALIHYGGFVAVGVSSFLIWVAYYMGIKFEDYISTGYKVGEDNLPSDWESLNEKEEDEAGIQMEEMTSGAGAWPAEERDASDAGDEDSSVGRIEEGQQPSPERPSSGKPQFTL